MKTNIAALNDKSILEHIKRLCKKEDEVLTEILLHLVEIENRRLFQPLGYSSLYEYCQRALKYSKNESMRRIGAARCINKFPEVYQLLLSRKVTLTSINIFYPILSNENKEEILSKVQGLSKIDVEKLVSHYQPRPKPFEKITPIVVENRAEGFDFRDGFYSEPEQGELIPDKRRQDLSRKAAMLQSEKEERYKLEFSISKEVYQKLERAKQLCGNSGNTREALEIVFGKVLDEYVEKHCPVKCEERRVKRAKKKAERTMLGEQAPKKRTQANFGYIARSARDKVMVRDGLCCSYVSEDGVHCRARTNLQIDHITPRSEGGRGRVDNLRVLCRSHNLLVAEEKLGEGFMRQFYSKKNSHQFSADSS